jgi:hypothetical protein
MEKEGKESHEIKRFLANAHASAPGFAHGPGPSPYM